MADLCTTLRCHKRLFIILNTVTTIALTSKQIYSLNETNQNPPGTYGLMIFFCQNKYFCAGKQFFLKPEPHM